MRLNLVYFKKHPRSPQNENKVPFKELYPMALKNTIQTKSRTTLEDKCLFEMSLLFACWKENEFTNVACNKFIENLQNCYQKFRKDMIKQKEEGKREIPIPNTKVYTNKQLNYLLRKYPNV